MSQNVILGDRPLCIQDVVSLAEGSGKLVLSEDLQFRARLQKSADFLKDHLQKGGEIYGVTTGYGDSCTVEVGEELIEQLPMHLSRYHGCGLGENFSETETRAIQVTRIASLVQGSSGVRVELLEFLIDQFNLGIWPRIPQEGSVGASGDLTPLSYLAATAFGEGEVFFKGRLYETAALFKELNIQAVGLKPKEGLAIMNGTAVMTALACLSFSRAQYLSSLSSRISAMNSVAMLGNPEHFESFLFEAKPHPGQALVAKWIREAISPDYVRTKFASQKQRLQDRYSIRCAPHVIGVLQDALPFFKTMIETELNSANDNPLVDGLGEKIYHGGNFYGGHIAFAMDSLKTLVANVADLLDRQLALLVDPKFNNGLEANLSGAEMEKSINHGFKAVQIAASAWTAEALKLCMPASIFSRSTECHNQDKVSMGTIAARDCLRVLQLTEQVTAATLAASAQALQLRLRQNTLNPAMIGSAISKTQKEIENEILFVQEDRRLEKDLRRLIEKIRRREFSLGDS